MLKALSIETLKTKRTLVRQLIWVFPFLVAIVAFLLFAAAGYVAQSIINQWSCIWFPLFLALIIGLNDRHEKNSTEYKMILSSPDDLFSYELGRILHGSLQGLITSLVLVILVCVLSFVTVTSVSVSSIVLAIFGLWLVNLWQVPLYTWISRLTNMYVTVLIAAIGVFIGIEINEYDWGEIWPFTWSEIFPISLIKIKINGLPIANTSGLSNNYWTIGAALVLFVILSYLGARSFRNQVKKND